ncbi:MULTISPECIES: double zinc ribbon domain-containing protein [Comamonas]|uniref:double zinc ribbon domain-containing protein n=1 Tax=Comamonas TaxID=283 RepID=UPI0009B6832E|nr:zinc-ribbon domain-containing protein [Comamonas sp.]TYK70000.1 zinc-ribbon domain-containing protein [Comamonas sp. Z3]TZG06760.1 zinc-ribbon domain-containing protein [Comamonas thiooxydans]
MSFFERLLGGHHRSGGDQHGNGHHQKRTPASYNDPRVSGGIICPNCRTQSSPQARFCQQCGSGLAPQACNACGVQMALGSRFCANCGKSA